MMYLNSKAMLVSGEQDSDASEEKYKSIYSHKHLRV
jgi:hypothetical protein